MWTHTHTHTPPHTHTHTHKDTQTNTDIHRHTDTQTHRHTDTHRHTQTHRHTHTQTHRHTDTHVLWEHSMNLTCVCVCDKTLWPLTDLGTVDYQGWDVDHTHTETKHQRTKSGNSICPSMTLSYICSVKKIIPSDLIKESSFFFQ